MQKYTGKRRSLGWLLIFYFLPYSFFAMWSEWANPPAGGQLPLELAMTLLPLGVLAFICGWNRKFSLLLGGNGLELLVPLGCVLAVSFLGLTNPAGDTFPVYFRPVGAVGLSLVSWAMLFLFQLLLYGLASRIRAAH
jgi:hypothetical protein